MKNWTLKEQLTSTDLNANFTAVLGAAVYNEDLSAYTNGSDITFSTLNGYKLGTLRVYVSNGPSAEMYRKKKGTGPSDGDYVEVLDAYGNGVSFSFNSFVPPSSSKLVVDYQKAIP